MGYIQVPGEYGSKMMVPEEDCIWTKKDGKLIRYHILGTGFCLMEFEGLEGTIDERIQQCKDNRAAAAKEIGLKPKEKPKKKATSDWLLGDW